VAISSRASTAASLPFTLLRRLEGVLEATKANVLVEYDKVQEMGLSEEAQEKLLLRAADGLRFFTPPPPHTHKMELYKVSEAGIKGNLESYIQVFYYCSVYWPAKLARLLCSNFGL